MVFFEKGDWTENDLLMVRFIKLNSLPVAIWCGWYYVQKLIVKACELERAWDESNWSLPSVSSCASGGIEGNVVVFCQRDRTRLFD